MAKPNNTKMQVTSYEKEFNSFAEMINELKEVHPEIKNIFKYDEEEVSPVNAASDVTEYFLHNAPDVINRTNLPVALSISSNKMSLKTNKFFAIKWRFKYDTNGFVTDLVAGVSVFTKDKVSETIKNTLEYFKDENNGWKVEEPRVREK